MIKRSGGNGDRWTKYIVTANLSGHGRYRLEKALHSISDEKLRVKCGKLELASLDSTFKGYIDLMLGETLTLDEAVKLANVLPWPLRPQLNPAVISDEGVGPLKIMGNLKDIARNLEDCNLQLALLYGDRDESAAVFAECSQAEMQLILVLTSDGKLGQIEVKVGEVLSTDGLRLGDGIEQHIARLGQPVDVRKMGQVVCYRFPNLLKVEYCVAENEAEQEGDETKIQGKISSIVVGRSAGNFPRPF